VTAGYICDEPRSEFFKWMDAANVDLKAFSEAFYHKLTGSHLNPVLDTLKYLIHETDVWVELTTLLIPGENDSERELEEMTQWVVTELGPGVPMHFTAFHPDYKLKNVSRTPFATLTKARDIALKNGVHYAYTGNVHDKRGESTYCHQCGEILIGRDWYNLSEWNLDENGNCLQCHTAVAGRFSKLPGNWGSKRLPVTIKG
jgi:pyruvate formate lyase activating enzyme